MAARNFCSNEVNFSAILFGNSKTFCNFAMSNLISGLSTSDGQRYLPEHSRAFFMSWRAEDNSAVISIHILCSSEWRL